jgi:hypothetical protein
MGQIPPPSPVQDQASSRYYKTLATQYVPPPPPPASYFLIGAPYSDIDSANSGRVYVYDSITENGQTPDSYIDAPLGVNSYFGTQMTQNSTHIAVTAYGEETFEGSVYLYDKSDLTATPTRLHPLDGQPYDFNGGNGISMTDTHLVISGTGDDDRGTSSGSAYVYDLTTNQLIKKLYPSGSGSNIRFGFNCAVSDTHVAVASSGQSANSAYAASLYVWELSNLNAAPTHMQATSYSSLAANASLGGGGGQTLVLHDDKLITSNRSGTSDDNWSGEVLMFDINNLSAEPTIFEAPPATPQSRIGDSLRVRDNKLYAGGSGYGVWIWDLGDISADPVQIDPPAGTTEWGEHIDVFSNSLLVGAARHSSDQGSAYLYDLGNLSADPIMITTDNIGQEEYFGKSVLVVE